MRNILFVLVLAVLILYSPLRGVEKVDLQKERKILMKLDQSMSGVSEKQGVLKALLPYMTEETVLFPLKGYPVQGKKALAAVMDKVKAEEWEKHVFWVSLFSVVSGDGNLAYTYGRYEIPWEKDRGKDEEEVESEGGEPHYYGTIWKRDASGKWKIAVSQGLVLVRGLGHKRLESRLNIRESDQRVKPVVDTELAFSAYSVENGVAAAFYKYIDEDGIAVGLSGEPRTRRTYARAIETAKKSPAGKGPQPKLEWEPYYSFVCGSGDLAYNYGPYVYTAPDARGELKKYYGYFVTLWKKQEGGGWKFIFDGGSECPPPVGAKLEN